MRLRNLYGSRLKVNNSCKKLEVFYCLGTPRDLRQVEELVRFAELYFDLVALIILERRSIEDGFNFINQLGFFLPIFYDNEKRIDVKEGEIAIFSSEIKIYSSERLTGFKELRKVLGIGELNKGIDVDGNVCLSV